MARLSTWLLVAGLVALGVVAALSSVRSGGGERPPAVQTEAVALAPPTAPAPDRRSDRASERAAAAAALRPAGVLGTLFFADGSCRLRAVRLPDLTSEAAPSLTACHFAVAGDRPSPRGVAWRPDGRLAASCRADRIEVFPARPGEDPLRAEPLLAVDGCAPAFRPDGTLTFVRDGELLALAEDCGAAASRCEELLLPRDRLTAALGGTGLRGLRSAAVKEVAWLSNASFVAVLHGERKAGKEGDVVALFRGTRLVASPPLSRPSLSLLRVSPLRTYTAVQADPAEGVWLLRAAGDSLAIERFPPWSPPAPTDVEAIAWSPDERWAAIASRTAVYVFRPTHSEEGFIGLPFEARDLAWVAPE